MSTVDDSQERNEQPMVEKESSDNVVSRRAFLRMAAVTACAVGVSGGVGGVLASCGSSDATTTTVSSTATSSSATTATTAASTTTTGSESSTTVSTGAEPGRAVKLGYVLPATGSLAAYGIGKDWVLKHVNDAVGKGLVLADKKSHPVEIITVDAQSDSSRAAQVTSDLIQNSKVDIVLSIGTPEITNPSADIAEAMGTPSLSTFTEWTAFTMGRKAPKEGFKWTYMFGWANGPNAIAFSKVFEQVPSNKVIGLIFGNDSNGMAWSQWAPGVFKGAGLNVVTTDLFNIGAEDYTSQISVFKKAGCELLMGCLYPPDFTNFWKQSLQQSFKPKSACLSVALIFPAAVNSLGDIAINLVGEGSWTPNAKFVDSLKGMTCQQLADSYEAAVNRSWDETLCGIVIFEWAVDVLKRATNIDDKQTIVDAILSTNMQTGWGPINYTLPVAEFTHRPHVNVYTAPAGACQWVKGKGKWPYDRVVVSSLDPDLLQIEGPVQPLQYS